jgi:hypothetical protein
MCGSGANSHFIAIPQAKQSSDLPISTRLLRRYAPRNDTEKDGLRFSDRALSAAAVDR